jgi:regulator of replication initiation timing
MNSVLLRHLEKGGLWERFIQRGRAEGIRFSDDLESRHDEKRRELSRLTPLYGWVAAAAMLAVIIAGLGYRAVHQGLRRSVETGVRLPEKRAVRSQDHSGDGLKAKLAELQATIEDSRKTIAELRNRNTLMQVRIEALEKDLGASQNEYQSLQETRERLSNMNAQLTNQSDRNAQLLAQAQAEIEDVRAHEKEMDSEIGAARAEVGTLSEQLKLQMATIDRERVLLAAGRDITDLMGARDLHIIDVHDADARGKDSKCFGRIFYTEGKSLIFYAYDLDDRKLANAKYSFAVWGERHGEPTTVRSLGMLYADDKEQRRWALKVDDPRQLAEIDSVFVTLESRSGGDRPHGHKILYAFLGGEANHP